VLAFLDMGFAEMVVCALVALVLFGGRLPEVMRNLGATYRNFRKGMEDLKHQAGVDVRMPPIGPAKPYAPMPPPRRDPAFPPPEPAALPVAAAAPPAASAAAPPAAPPTSASAGAPNPAPPAGAGDDEPPLV
jgi:TatA/E family protein of Tat protein translocase